VADDDKEFDVGMGPLDDDVALLLLPLLLRLLLVLFADDETRINKMLISEISKEFETFSYPFLIVVVVALLLKLAMGFAVKTQRRRELGANFDSIGSRRD
jgi:hypothetical protein